MTDWMRKIVSLDRVRNPNTLNMKEMLTMKKILAKSAVMPKRRTIVKTPKEYGMEYRDIEFQAEDGIDLKAWHIPASSDRLIIFTHPMPFNRYGFPKMTTVFEKGSGI